MTDKFENGLIEIYERHFAEFKNKPIKLLEIGIFAGDSLDYFAKYFTNPKATITGVDVTLPKDRADKRIKMIEKDQRDPSLAEIEANIIIDDASHVAEFTAQTFDILWPTLKPGGVYVIEDWQGSKLPDMEALVLKLTKEIPGNKILYRNDKPLGAIAFFYKEAE